MFYLTTHSTHFIYGYMASDMVKDHSDSERGNPLPPHGLLFLINSKASFICPNPQTGYHIPQPVVEHWLERETAQWVHSMKDQPDDPSHHEREREMFYLTTHSTHFILRLYDVRHMVKDHSDSEKGNPLPPHRLLFPINSKGSFICTIPQTG